VFNDPPGDRRLGGPAGEIQWVRLEVGRVVRVTVQMAQVVDWSRPGWSEGAFRGVSLRFNMPPNTPTTTLPYSVSTTDTGLTAGVLGGGCDPELMHRHVDLVKRRYRFSIPHRRYLGAHRPLSLLVSVLWRSPDPARDPADQVADNAPNCPPGSPPPNSGSSIGCRPNQAQSAFVRYAPDGSS
jgi:hypothetical protein